MPRRFFRRLFPDHRYVREHKHLQFFGTLLHDPNLFHLNRRSVAGAFAVGLFMAFVPIPFQMVTAAALAILFRVNLPIAVALVWVTNPLTIAPLFFFAYKIGEWLLGTPSVDFSVELSWEWLKTDMVRIWQPFLLGCLVLSSTLSLLGYTGVRVFWRVIIIRRLERKRNKARKLKQRATR